MAVAAAALMVGEASAQDPQFVGVSAPSDAPMNYSGGGYLTGWLNSRLSDGGPFLSGEYVMYRQTNPIKDQVLAVEGFTVTQPGVVPDPSNTFKFAVGTFVGTAATALDAQEVSGTQYSPGYKIDFGWRFEDSSVLSLSWLRLFNATYTAGATFAQPSFNVGQNLQNSFLSSPVFNFPQEFSGPPKIVDANNVVQPGAAVGIWNGAQEESIKFETRTEQWNLTYRLAPFYETENTRLTGYFGGQYFRIHDEFYWNTIDIDVTTGLGGGQNEGDYTAIASNNLWGVHTGMSWEQYIGNGFAVQLDLDAAASIDIVRERAEYTLGLKFSGPEGKKSRSDYTLAPELSGSLGLMWYPTKGVQVRLGYNAMAFFNTIGTENPVGFDFAAPDPKFDRIPVRLFDGFDFGVALIF